MKYYPVFLRVAGRPCLVIGGGRVAERKVRSLLSAGARVAVISPDLCPTLAALATADHIEYQQRHYAPGDVEGFFLACAATSDDALHARIAQEADAAGVLLNVADRPHLCTFIMPAVLERGDLVIATSTSGRSPALANRVRRQLEAAFGEEYDLALQILGRLRTYLAERSLSAAERRRIFMALVDSPLLEHLRARHRPEVDHLLATTVGAKVTLASLGVELS